MSDLRLKITPARKAFKENLGQANHFLITIIIGLDAVKDGTAELKPGLSTSWNPKDRGNSADRSRGFASRAALAFLVDSIDAYCKAVDSAPKVLCRKSLKESLEETTNTTDRFARLAAGLGLEGTSSWALLNVARAWRHRVLHTNARTSLNAAVRKALEEHEASILADYAGLEIGPMLENFSAGGDPRFKEITALIRAGHKFVESADRELLASFEIESYSREALDAYVMGAEKTERRARVANIWGKDETRRLRTVSNILRNYGCSLEGSSAEDEPSALVEELADQKPSAVISRLGI